MSDYPHGLTLRPIVPWPGKATENRQRSNFSAPWRSTLDSLDRELHYLGKGEGNASGVLQIAMREQDFRLDGMPRSNAQPTHPGVILAIESKHGPLSYPCDKFTRWQDNLRAIVLALEALRKVDRYGVTKNAEQYTGWKQLGAGDLPEHVMSPTEAELLIRKLAGDRGQMVGNLQNAYRRARAAVHPDRNTGSRSDWDRVEAAAEVLRAAGRL